MICRAPRGLAASLLLALVLCAIGRAADKDKIYRDGEKQIRRGQYEKAAHIFLELIKMDERDLRAHLGASLAYLKMQNYNLCFDHASRAIKVDPNNARAHSLVGMALLRSGYLAEALQYFIRALELNRKDAMAFGGIAEIDYYENRTNESRLRAYYAHTLDPKEPDYLITLARACSRLERFQEAADAYEEFLHVAPKTDSERRERIRGLINFYRQLAGLKVHQINGPRVAEIPFWLGSDRRPYIKVQVNGREAIFVIDTGSGFTVVSEEAAKRLGVPKIARGGSSQGVGGSGKFPIVYGLIRSVQLGPLKITSVPCFIRRFHGSHDRPDQERADGFIGLSILSNFLTELDYKKLAMRLDRGPGDQLPSLEPSQSVSVVPFRTTQNGLISIETRLDGDRRINAILDSGASSSVISSAAVERLNLRHRIVKGQTVQVIGAAGIASNVEIIFLPSYRVADLEQNNIRALILDFNAINETSGFEQSGIVGGDFLRHFRVIIDFTKSQVAFEPQTSAITRIRANQAPKNQVHNGPDSR